MAKFFAIRDFLQGFDAFWREESSRGEYRLLSDAQPVLCRWPTSCKHVGEPRGLLCAP